MNDPLRIVLFGSGSPLSLEVFDALASRDILAVVVPGSPRLRGPRSLLRRLERRLATRSLAQRATLRDVPLLVHSPGRDARLVAQLVALAPDLICVATFPWLLPPAILIQARLGAVGLHPSLLPRHRGPDPLFWTYVQDDREAGVTLHFLDEGEDTGDVLAQKGIPLARGRPVAELYAELAELGAELLAGRLESLARGVAPRAAQDPRAATREPVPPAQWPVALEEWGSERVWHTLRGLGATGRLVAPRERPVRLGPAHAFRIESHGRPAGMLEPARSGWRIYCRDGVVEASAAPRRRWPR